MSAFIAFARRYRWRAAVAGVATIGAIAIGRAPRESVPTIKTSIYPIPSPRPAIRVDDPPAPAELPPWATRPDHRAQRIAGRVVGEDGAPIPPIVHLRLATHAELWRGLDVATDARGRFDFGVMPAGAYHLIADAPGLGSRVVDVPDDGSDVELILHACERVRGAVTSGGVPVIGARITHGGVTLAHSGAGGRFELCATEPWLDVRAPGLALAKEFVDDDHGQVVAQMWPTQRFTGRVVDEHGRPRAGIAIVPTIDDPGPNQYAPGASAATTGADGAFALDLPDPHAPIAGAAALPRRYEIWASVFDRFDTVMYMDDAIATAPFALTLRDDELIAPDPHVFVARVRGTIVRDGRPVADAWVDIDPTPEHGGQFTRTRADGTFELALEADQLGDLVLSASDGDDGGHEATRRIHVRTGQHLQLGAIKLTP